MRIHMALPDRPGPMPPVLARPTRPTDRDRSPPGSARRPGFPFYSIRTHHVEPVSPDLHRSLDPRRRAPRSPTTPGRRPGAASPRPRPGGRSPGPARRGSPSGSGSSTSSTSRPSSRSTSRSARSAARSPTPSARCTPSSRRSSWTAARPSRSSASPLGPDKAALHLPPRRRHAGDHPRQAPRARRHARAGHRVRRLARPRHPLHPPRPRLPREADGHLDPGRGRGHPPLAPLLRLPQRPRHRRDDRHGREAR